MNWWSIYQAQNPTLYGTSKTYYCKLGYNRAQPSKKYRQESKEDEKPKKKNSQNGER